MAQSANPFTPISDTAKWNPEFDEIDGLAELKLINAAWERLQKLPPELQTSNRAARARIPCLLAFGNLDLAIRFAGALRHGDAQDRLVTSSAFMAVAAHCFTSGRASDGCELVELAVKSRPDLESAIRSDSRIPAPSGSAPPGST